MKNFSFLVFGFLVSCSCGGDKTPTMQCLDHCQTIYATCKETSHCDKNGYCMRDNVDTPECRELLGRCFDTCKAILDSPPQDKK